MSKDRCPYGWCLSSVIMEIGGLIFGLGFHLELGAKIKEGGDCPL